MAFVAPSRLQTACDQSSVIQTGAMGLSVVLQASARHCQLQRGSCTANQLRTPSKTSPG